MARTRFLAPSRVGAMFAFLAMLFTASPAISQSLTCGTAVSRLQQYVAGVNQFANGEYYQAIPARCGGNQQCMYWWLQQLNGWYMQQSNAVNGWYQQIQAGCSNDSSGKKPKRITKKQPRDAAPELDEEDVASLEVDDEDKTVRIRIPSNPSGYR
ncbi:MAG: hypothetical protein JWQ07_3221 [Ramlibacter sp.]|nr:hypothetical protein [Ramlibacter sp.]